MTDRDELRDRLDDIEADEVDPLGDVHITFDPTADEPDEPADDDLVIDFTDVDT